MSNIHVTGYISQPEPFGDFTLILLQEKVVNPFDTDFKIK